MDNSLRDVGYSDAVSFDGEEGANKLTSMQLLQTHRPQQRCFMGLVVSDLLLLSAAGGGNMRFCEHLVQTSCAGA
jgi:hypothetical protein